MEAHGLHFVQSLSLILRIEAAKEKKERMLKVVWKMDPLMLRRSAIVQFHAKSSEGYPGQNISKGSLSNARRWV